MSKLIKVGDLAYDVLMRKVDDVRMLGSARHPHIAARQLG